MARTQPVAQGYQLFNHPMFIPGMTWGLGNRAAYTPGPGGPLTDPRRFYSNPAPIFGRAVEPLNAFGPQLPGTMWAPWSQMVFNNAFATQILDLYVPEWLKQPPSPSDGF